ncbi:mechanosensitive ion channel family protein [Roseovarius indicus]|uniref:mechanosensitive ion channel family protein n=1 Tax=Roseovarius indicus TaxID=540747 RepID=UPI0013748144|nr:mechanosensitive ion channel family protein [Roseovarius indicus]
MTMIPFVRLFLVCLLCLLGAVAGAQEDSQSWYEAEDLNTGLGAAPDNLDRSTPRAAMRSFIDLTDQERFNWAAHILNLSDLPVGQQAEDGPRLAAMLASVIERRIWVNWSGLSARPDAMVESEAGNNPRAGETRRNIRIELVEVNGQAYEVRLARYKESGQDPVWLFTPQTVEDVPGLFAEFGPRRFERFIPQSLKTRAGPLRAWEWIALPLYLAILGLLLWGTNRFVLMLSKKTSRAFLRQAIDRAAMPLALMVTAFVAQLFLNLAVSFSGPVTNVVRPALVIIMVSGFGIAALRVVDAILDRITLRVVGDIDDTRSLEKRELYTSIFALRRIIVLFMVGFAIVYVLLRLNLFESIGMTLLASAGVLTVLLGIAGQAVLGNILASLQIALAKPVRIGDSILFEDNWAYVESIYYTFIRLRTWDERRIVVPVRYFVSKPFENWSVRDARIYSTIKLILDHSADIGELREKFIELAKAKDGVIDHDKLCAYVSGQTSNGQEMSFYVMSPDPSTGWETEMQLREDLLNYIRENHPDWWPRERVMSEGGATSMSFDAS